MARTVPGSSDVAALLNSTTVSADDFYLSGLVAFLEMAQLLLAAAERQLYDFGFGADTERTRRSLIAGLKSINQSNPISDIIQPFVFFDTTRQARINSQVVAYLGENNIKPFVLVTATGVAAVFDSTVQAQLQAPTEADYKRVANSDSNDGDDGGSSVWWVGVLVPLVVLAAAAIFAAVLVRRRRQQRKRAAILQSGFSLAALHQKNAPRPVPHVVIDEINVKQLLPAGAFGSLAIVSLDGSAVAAGTGLLTLWYNADLTSASPRPSKSLDPKLLEELQQEVDILCALDSHPCVIHVMALVVDVQSESPGGERPLGWVMEYCSGGDLHGLLRRRALHLETKLRIAHELAQGLEFITSSGAVHLDLCARHVFLTANMHCKLSHLGTTVGELDEAWWRLKKAGGGKDVWVGDGRRFLGKKRERG